MKKALSTLLTVLLGCTLVAQTQIPSGPVYGEWTSAGSPYLIEGEILIPVDLTLEIEAGVEVIFQGHYKFIIQGCLQAVGAEGDSIHFTADDPETGWHSLRFLSTETNGQSQSVISYCIVEYGMAFGDCPDNKGGGVYIDHSNPLVKNSSIRHNQVVSGLADWGGGGIYTEFANPEIRDNLITNNYSGNDAGGVYIGMGSPLVENNKIANNQADNRGGGIACFNFASPDILGNQIENNQANSTGGGIYQSGGNSLIQGNEIQGNISGQGGGIACFLSDSRIYNNLVVENEANSGGALWNQGSSPKVFNNTILDNMAQNYGGGMMNIPGMAGIIIYSNPLIANNIFFGNLAEMGTQIYSNPDNTPILSYNNVEGVAGGGIYGEFSNGGGNMDSDPEFDTEGEHDCALTGESPCIDKGINVVSGSFQLPETDILGNKRKWDGDGDEEAVVDMGAYEYGSSPLGFSENIIDDNFAVKVFPNPFTRVVSLEYELRMSAIVSFDIYDEYGKRVWMSSDQQVPGIHLFDWDAKDMSCGIYYCKLTINQKSQVVKLFKFQ